LSHWCSLNSTELPAPLLRMGANYVAALNHGVDRLREGLPLPNRLVLIAKGLGNEGGRTALKQKTTGAWPVV